MIAKSASKIVIVGGGAIGVFTAYYLNRRGYAVTILEKNRIGSGSSHGNCGLVLPHILPINMPGVPTLALKWLFRKDAPFRISPLVVARNPGWFLGFLKHCTTRSAMTAAEAQTGMLLDAEQMFGKVIEKESIDCDWQSNGVLSLFESEKLMHDHQHDVALERSLGVTAEFLSRDSLKREEAAFSSRLSGAWYYPRAGHLRPDRLMQEMKRILIKKGVEIQEETGLKAFRQSGDRVIGVMTENDTVEADAVVLATGAWTAQLQNEIGLKIPIQPGKGYSCTFSGIQSPLDLPCIFADKKVVLTPLKDGIRIGGMMAFNGFDDTISPARIDSLINSVPTLFSSSSPAHKEEEWCGWRPMTFDGLPFIDYLGRLTNVIVAAGHNMVGISMAPSTGQLVADFLDKGAPTLDPNPFGFARLGNRFKH